MFLRTCLWWFLKIYISQGSVTTQLRCGGIFNNRMGVKVFWKSVNSWQRHGQKFAAYFFGPPVYKKAVRSRKKTALCRCCNNEILLESVYLPRVSGVDSKLGITMVRPIFAVGAWAVRRLSWIQSHEFLLRRFVFELHGRKRRTAARQDA